MNAQAPRELALAVAGLLPLTPEVKVVSVTGPQTIRQELEGGASAPSFLGVAGGDLMGQLVEVVREVVPAQSGHPDVDTTPVLPRGEALALEDPRPALPHPVSDVLHQR